MDKLDQRRPSGARLVPELICSDLKRSLHFYVGILGFQVRYDRPDEQFAYLERDGAELMLEQPTTGGRLAPRAELAYPYGRGINFEINVADVDRLHTAAAAAGIAMYLPLEDRWYGRAEDEIGVRQFAVQDPDGYLIRLSQEIATRPKIV
jgi:lactoylglutathione lyase